MNKILALIILMTAFYTAEARINPEILKKMKKQSQLSGSRSDCQPSQAQYDLEINNVRAKLLAGGDLWWDLVKGSYFVPKPAPGAPEVSSIFAGGVWVGGIDPNGALKLSGVTYRSGNNTDYYSGPLDMDGQTNIDICNDWDRHFTVKREDILIHQNAYNLSVKNGEDYDCESIPDDVKYWPARGNPFFSDKYDFSLPDQNLADFFDEDTDGVYNPCAGDYPILSMRGCGEIEIPDEIVYWIFNDNGGPHRLSNAIAIQMEVQAQAFAYITQNEINNMTFYRYKLINKATDDLRDCYFGLWTDPDLGCSLDDYIGCDVERSLAYVYNEDAVDGVSGSSCEGVNTYGENVPIVGIDYFRGPTGPKVFCGVDQDGNNILCNPEPGTGQVDTIVELGMTSFTYQNNSVNNAPQPTRDPQIDFEFYNILQGKWKDGTAITYGNSGFDPASTDTTKFVFPGAPNDETGWSMCTAELPFDDRRTVQATGPLLLQPGATNELIFGVVFVPYADYPCPSIKKLQFTDDLAQALFDNCFKIGEEGPDAPDMEGIELDQQLILLLSNDETSNNAELSYIEEVVLAPLGTKDPYYRFEGYEIYQLADASVSRTELDNIEKARLIRQVDIKNGVDEIFNWTPIDNPNSPEPIWIPELQVKGEDKGIRHSFNIEKDYFSVTNELLQNGTEYYYTVIAYAHNDYKPYDAVTNIGQKTPYIESNRNVKVYTYTPRALDDMDIPTTYGQETGVTRIEGIGTSFNTLDMADGEIESILDGSFDGEITYKPGNSPINPKIVNPLGIKDGKYRLEIVGEYNDSTSNLKRIRPGAKWNLTHLNTGEVIASHKSIDKINEQIIHGKGFSIEVGQVGEPGEQFDESNGGIAQVYDYADDNLPKWWNAIPAYNGIEVVSNGNSEFLFSYAGNDPDDPLNALAKIDEGFFMPIKSAKWNEELMPYISPAWYNFQGFTFGLIPERLRFKDLNNVDIVFTPDKSKWSRCVVVETAIDAYEANGLLNVGNKNQFELRASPSIDQDGNIIAGESGMSYFPGYAIDVETGERLNIFFGENSVFSHENDVAISQANGINVNTGGIGADMIWNPTSQLFTDNTPEDWPIGSYRQLLGGQHYIYVTRQEYDGCQALSELLNQGGVLNLVEAVSFITWTGIPLPQQPLLSIEEGLIPNNLTVKLRVANPFNRELDSPNLKKAAIFEAVGGFPLYEFGFEDVEATDIVSTEEEPQILDEVVISPNPYHESLASGQGSNEIRISNLPPGAIATVYTFEGKFVRRIGESLRSSFSGIESTQLDWDLNDRNGARISSGMYIIHIAVPHLGVHKSLKWIKL